MRATLLMLLFAAPVLAQSPRGTFSAAGAEALAWSGSEGDWRTEWKRQRFGEPPQVSAVNRKKIEEARLPDYKRGIFDRMLKGERPTELTKGQVLKVQVGDFGTIDRPFIVDEVIDGATAFCYFVSGGSRSWDEPFILKGRDTRLLIVGRAYDFGSDFVVTRKSEDYSGLRKGMLVIEVLDKHFGEWGKVLFPRPLPEPTTETEYREDTLARRVRERQSAAGDGEKATVDKEANEFLTELDDIGDRRNREREPEKIEELVLIPQDKPGLPNPAVARNKWEKAVLKRLEMLHNDANDKAFRNKMYGDSIRIVAMSQTINLDGCEIDATARYGRDPKHPGVWAAELAAAEKAGLMQAKKRQDYVNIRDTESGWTPIGSLGIQGKAIRVQWEHPRAQRDMTWMGLVASVNDRTFLVDGKGVIFAEYESGPHLRLGAESSQTAATPTTLPKALKPVK